MTSPPGGSESEVRRQVAEYAELGPRRGVARLVRDLGSNRPPDASGHPSIILAALATISDAWATELRKRSCGTHKCPKCLQRLIERALAEVRGANTPGAKLSQRNIYRRARQPKSEGQLVIANADELGLFEEHSDFIRRLHELSQQRLPMELEVRFTCEHVYVHGLALLAAWCERNAARVSLVAEHDRVAQYLEATGFRDVVEKCQTIREPRYDGEHHVALTCVERSARDAADAVAKRIVELFAGHIDLDQEARDPLKISFAELVENVYRHAESNSPAYVMAQAYPATQKLHVAIVDTGIGVYNSFRNSEDAAIRARARTELQAIRMAVEKRVTSKTELHSGYGLFVVRRLVEENCGTMLVMSGRTTLKFWGHRDWRERIGPQDRAEPNRAWKGTEVSLMFQLDRPLPLLQVYGELSRPEEEDFFGRP